MSSAPRSVLDRPLLVALALFLVTAGGLWALPAAWTRGALAVLLGSIAGIYVGLGLAGGDRRAALAESAQAGVFGGLAVAGLVGAWGWLALGLAAHALWDAAHHLVPGLAHPPRGYAAFCAAYDLLLGAFVVALFLR